MGRGPDEEEVLGSDLDAFGSDPLLLNQEDDAQTDYVCVVCRGVYPLEFFSRYRHKQKEGSGWCDYCWAARLQTGRCLECSESATEGSLCASCWERRVSRCEQELSRISKDPKTRQAQINASRQYIRAVSRRDLSPRERRAIARARALVAKRGWRQEWIEVFILDHLQQSELIGAEIGAEEYNRWTSSSLGPVGVAIAWNERNQALSEDGLARLIVHEMVHSRSHAISDGQGSRFFDDEEILPRDGLYQIMEGITEMIAEDIMPAPKDFEIKSLTINTDLAREFFARQTIGVALLEKLSQDEAVLLLAERMGIDLDTLGQAL